MAIEIVSFPIKNGGSFHSYVNVYQRVGGFPIHGVTVGDPSPTLVRRRLGEIRQHGILHSARAPRDEMQLGLHRTHRG